MKVLLTLLLSASAAFSAALPQSAKIDELLAKEWQKHGLQANAPTTDEIFLRRVYVDIVGRIPTIAEASRFLADTSPTKRATLIDSLLASPGYISNQFNYFADLLRLQTDTKGQLTGYAYANWLKAALAKNQPYDSMVRELLTTDGAVWDSGAIGFYMRDQGMPLDHLAATVQVFLGTRIECAQCHNHPFDKWTQMDYYKMAAFTYGMDSKRNYGGIDMRSGIDKKTFNRPENAQLRKDLKMVQESMKEVGKTLRYTQIAETDKLPKLPHDYQYKDAKAGDTVQPKTMFGHEATPVGPQTRIDAFAEWMASPENPRFTTVIANRLWKRVMGMGLIEPVDEMTDSTVPSNPALMAHLEKVMMDVKYDVKAFLRVIYNSEVYQRMPSQKDVALGDTYHFTGPLMRRLSAEQVWDSIATLVKGDIDAKAASENQAADNRAEVLGKLYDSIKEQSLPEIIARVKANGGAANPEKEAKIKALTEEMTEARRKGEKEKANALAAQIKKLRGGERGDSFAAILGEEAAKEFQTAMKQAGDIKQTGKPNKSTIRASISKEEIAKIMAEGGDKKAQRAKIMALRNKGSGKAAEIVSTATRASDLPSPAPRGHMLRTFGQSDRELIDNSSRETAVPQALHLLNGPVADALINRNSEFGNAVAQAASTDAKLDTIYLGLLSRKPTASEKAVLASVATERGDQASADIIHALLNTGEFLFVK